MTPLVIVIANIVDILVGALTHHPEYEPHLGPVLADLIPVLSRSAGETPEQTEARRKVAEGVFAAQAAPIVAPEQP